MKRLAGAAAQPSDIPYQTRRQENSSTASILFVDKLAMEEMLQWSRDPSEGLIFGVEIPLPANEEEWRKILKHPAKFTAKSLHKGAEVSWARLSKDQQAAMGQPKQLEVQHWLEELVVEKYKGVIPAGRLMRMRWVLTLKAGENKSDVVTCKARIVLLGYSDPHLLDLATAAPTLTRRSRLLMLNLCTHQRWRITKADAKSAFHQGASHQGSRNVFTIPVPELAEGLGIAQGEAVRLLKSAYGLASAARDWFLDVKAVLEQKCGLRQLKSDPCVWVRDSSNGVKGIIGVHMDDFLLAGDMGDPGWNEAVRMFKESFQWSPWEDPPFLHCGVEIQQMPDFSFRLNHAAYCEELKQVEIEKGEGDITEGERAQARALLGAAQWRVQQSAPQHAAKLSWLQSALPRGNKDTLAAINKLCREMYAQRHLSVATYALHVGWTDAAVGNRPDLSSTGGMAIALVSPKIFQGQRSHVNLVAWRSGKLSLSAEIQAPSEGEQELMACRLQWAELPGHRPDLRRPWDTASKIAGALVVDAKSV